MELVLGAISLLGAFLGAIAAHFFAHDAYTRCPKYAQRILRAAIRKLGPVERQRYEEEWLADLYEREGVIEKFEHAIACYFCAGKIAATWQKRLQAPIDLTFTGAGAATVTVDFVTGVYALASLRRIVASGRRLSLDDLEDLELKISAKYGKNGPSSDGLLAIAQAAEQVAFPTPPSHPNIRRYKVTVRLNGRECSIEEILSGL